MHGGGHSSASVNRPPNTPTHLKFHSESKVENQTNVIWSNACIKFNHCYSLFVCTCVNFDVGVDNEAIYGTFNGYESINKSCKRRK